MLRDAESPAATGTENEISNSASKRADMVYFPERSSAISHWPSVLTQFSVLLEMTFKWLAR
jgi:hypothetical protein